MSTIWDYARGRMDNKGVVTRIQHSAKLHSFRSAVSGKGSFASKGIAVGTMMLRAGVSAIPIPSIATSLINIAQQAVEARVRSHLHQKKLAGSTTQEDKVKFELKELTVDKLDRYRWKLKEAIEQLNVKNTGFNLDYKAKQAAFSPCNSWLEIAEAVEQANRRSERLRLRAEALKEAMEHCLDWTAKQQTEINKYKTNLMAEFGKLMKEENELADKSSNGAAFLQARHANCENYCWVNHLEIKENEKWTAVKMKLALVTKLVVEPLTMETFVSVKGDQYKMPKED